MEIGEIGAHLENGNLKNGNLENWNFGKMEIWKNGNLEKMKI